MALKINGNNYGHFSSVKSKCRPRSSIKNPHIEAMKEDILYHLGLTTSTDDLQIMFGDVKFVCVGGTPERMCEFAQYINKVLELNCSSEDAIRNVSKSSRYAMFKVGPVLCVSHGIGSPSISVVLHEIMKLMHHAGAEDPVFLRLGTCGGLGLPPGSLVITSVSVDGMLRPYQELVVLGQKVHRPSTLDEDLCKELKAVSDKYLKDCTVVVGKTMCADDFYEGQGRLDGAFCDYSQEDKLSYLKKLKEEGVANIEMESLTFAAMCRNAGIREASDIILVYLKDIVKKFSQPNITGGTLCVVSTMSFDTNFDGFKFGGVICVTLVDRLKDDQVKATSKMLKKWQKNVLHLAAMYIKDKLNGDT